MLPVAANKGKPLLQHVVEDFLRIRAAERINAREHEVNDDASGPHIDLDVIRLVRDDFWRHVERTAHFHSILLHRRKPKVCQLDTEVLQRLDQDVLRLDVAVHDALAVHIRQGVEDLEGNVLDLILGHGACV